MKNLKIAFVVAGFLIAACVQSKADDALVPLNIKLPPPAFMGTPSQEALPDNVEKPTGKPRPPFMAPAGLVNLALGKTVTCSVATVHPETLAKITDGVKEGTEENFAGIGKNLQWVQIDLGSPAEIYAIVVWHAFDSQKCYHGVVVQVADDAAFATNVRTVFNNDRGNVDQLGAGTDKEYFESNEGRLIDAKGVKGRYVRCYSRGSTENHLNEYVEVEVYGKPAK